GATSQPGTTSRVWTYPATGSSAGAIPASNLGPFRGSVAYFDPSTTGARQTIYVPTTQGRMYALDAVGNADRSTNVRWAYPAINQPTIGSIWT
ncbi:hypothetical protein ABTM39_19650, partial [Acinetobacter baumannii]